LDSKNIDFNKIKSLQNVVATQKFITTNGILRTKDNFAGIILKGVGEDFNRSRFDKFIVKGKIPQFKDNEVNQEIVISQKISKDINKGVNDSVVAIFAKEEQKQIYRKFKISGIYKTDIKMIDDLYIIGGINHARKVQNFGTDEIGGLEVFLKDNDNINETAIDIEKFIGLKNYIEKITEQFPQIVSWMEIFDTNIALIISIMLIVVVVNIIMILLILIIERTNSIGLLKTLGATNGQIRAIFINYTLMIMFPGLLVGNILGIGLLLIQRWYGIIKLNPENYYVSVVPVDLNIIYIAGVSVGILVVSGVSLILPSYLISKISPIKSIKMS
jgi:ABC superfamily ATP binding cassette transporter, permease protein